MSLPHLALASQNRSSSLCLSCLAQTSGRAGDAAGCLAEPGSQTRAPPENSKTSPLVIVRHATSCCAGGWRYYGGLGEGKAKFDKVRWRQRELASARHLLSILHAGGYHISPASHSRILGTLPTHCPGRFCAYSARAHTWVSHSATSVLSNRRLCRAGVLPRLRRRQPRCFPARCC